MIKDRFGRPIRSLRISVTSRCNLRCIYCHREGVDLALEEMKPEEIGELGKIAKELGVRKIKLTGGEPLLRKDIVEIVGELSSIGFDEVSMTTNGTLLARLAGDLADAGLNRVNISLDTLREDVYERITGSRRLGDVLAGIEAALEADLTPVKLNMVVLRGINEDEIEDLIEFSREKGAILQLIELLRIEGVEDLYVDLSEIEERLASLATYVDERRSMHNRRIYHLTSGAVVEVVRPMENPSFCMHCTRLRVTPDGKLKPCLMRNDNLVDFLGALRSGASREELRELFLEAVRRREPYFKEVGACTSTEHT